MTLLRTKSIGIFFAISLAFTSANFAQQGDVIVNQDSEITRLLELKKEINTNEDSKDRYRIQIFSGRRVAAEESQAEFKNTFTKWRSKLVYETPNYKIWVGSFKSHLEADRALLEIKKTFPNAFRFKPKTDKI
ncbi:SPOR domain-containing protein [Flavobacteriaceae bacterium A100]|uniref:SPOR domain-containing protein n=1 Tax=Oceanihabitans sediminis TaxID=1812012 RepID=UPI0009304FA8